jgi:hypothetical protein
MTLTCLTIVFVTAIATFVALIMAIVQTARHWEE